MLPKSKKKKEMRVKFRMPFLNVMKNLVSVESNQIVNLWNKRCKSRFVEEKKKFFDSNLLKYDPVFRVFLSYSDLHKPVFILWLASFNSNDFRGEGGELRLGIRRAAGPRNGLSDSIIKSQHSYPNVLAPVANAVSTNGTFQVFYSPR